MNRPQNYSLQWIQDNLEQFKNINKEERKSVLGEMMYQKVRTSGLIQD